MKADSDASRVRALELLGKTIGLFTDTVEVKETRDSEIASDIEEKIIALLEETNRPKWLKINQWLKINHPNQPAKTDG